MRRTLTQRTNRRGPMLAATPNRDKTTVIRGWDTAVDLLLVDAMAGVESIVTDPATTDCRRQSATERVARYQALLDAIQDQKEAHRC